MDAELRLFVRLPEDADESYHYTGDEKLVFLYINNGSETIRCRTNIVDGESGDILEHTKSVSIRSYEDKFEETDTAVVPPNPDGDKIGEKASPSDAVHEEETEEQIEEEVEETSSDLSQTEETEGTEESEPEPAAETEESETELCR